MKEAKARDDSWQIRNVRSELAKELVAFAVNANIEDGRLATLEPESVERTPVNRPRC